jgi:predicted AAA+ superfamily ATPase
LAASVFELDLSRQREAVANEPGQLARAPRPVLIDEWQRWPEVWDVVRRQVDAGAAPGTFLLTGSAAPLAAPVHSGAGRILPLRLRPMALSERPGLNPSVSLEACLGGGAEISGPTDLSFQRYAEEITSSGFPGIRTLAPQLRARQLRGYLDALVTRQFPAQGLTLRRPESLRRWLRAYAAAIATSTSYARILDAATPGDSDKLAKTTTIAYREVLASLWLLDDVPAWIEGEDFLSGLRRSPKHFLADPALAAGLLRLDSAALTAGRARTAFDPRYGSIAGRLFEGLTALSLKVYADAVEASVSHLRTADGAHEVDFIVQRGQDVVAIEVKLAPSVDAADVRHLTWLRGRLGDRLREAIIVNTGPAAYRRRTDGIAVVPLALLGP